MIDAEASKLAEAAYVPAICSLILKLQHIYGSVAPDVFEWVIRRSAICVHSGGGDWSMLTTLRHDLQEVVDRRTPVSHLCGFEHDERCQDL
jgi:hypothetical protein